MTDKVSFDKNLVVSGTTREDLITALNQNACTCIIGEDIDALGNLLLSEISDEAILTIAADCHIVHGRTVAESIAQRLQRQGVLPAKHFKNCTLMLHELITNAVEYGSLKLSKKRKELNNSAANIAQYYDLVAQKLTTAPDNQKPVFILCSIVDNELVIRIKDFGDGFNLNNVSMDPHETMFGRGVFLVRKFARHMYYEDGGRAAVFTLPSKISLHSGDAPSRLGAKNHGRIMVIESNAKHLDTLCNAFKRTGYKNIATAHHGSDGIAKALTFQPHLIFVNTQLNDMNGFDVCQALKAESKTKNIPILFIAHGYDPKEREKGYRLGAVDYINHPLDNNELIARAEVHLMNHMMLEYNESIGLKFRQDLEKARIFQSNMLPQPDVLEPLCARHNVLVEHDYRTCENLGGDYWTLLDIDDSHIGLILADFTGHGILAAMNTIRLHALFNELKTKTLLNPAATAHALNKKLYQMQEQQGMFVTFLYVVLNTRTGQFIYSKNGAPGMFSIQNHQNPLYFDCSGFPLGLLNAQEFSVDTGLGKLNEGDTLIAFSDALTENLHTNGRRWLIKGIQKKLNAFQDTATPSNTRNTLNLLRTDFDKTACQPISDDLTLVSLTFAP